MNLRYLNRPVELQSHATDEGGPVALREARGDA